MPAGATPARQQSRPLPRWRLGLAVASVALTQCTIMPSRPHPPHLADHSWTAADGKELPYVRWPVVDEKPVAPPRAILICVHGLSGAASDFWPLGQELPKRGIVVYGVQLRGQGNDPDTRRRGDIRAATEWQQDVREFGALVRARHPDAPIFWLGESMGSLIAIHTFASGSGPAHALPEPRGLVLLSPAVELREELPPWKACLVRSASRIVPGYRIPLARLDAQRVPGMRITRDASQSSQAPLTPHFVPALSLRLLREVDGMMRRSEHAARHLNLPLLVLYTPNDPVVSQAQVEAWFDRLATHDKTRLLFPNDFHLILHDEHRWSAVDQIGDWILQRARRR